MTYLRLQSKMETKKMLRNVLKSVQGWHGGIDQRSLVPTAALASQFQEKVPPKLIIYTKLNNWLKTSGAPLIRWHPEASKILFLFVSPANRFPFVNFFFVLVHASGFWVMDVEKFSSPEFRRAAVEMFKLQALCSYKYIYISISHLKCWNKWMF